VQSSDAESQSEEGEAREERNPCLTVECLGHQVDPDAFVLGPSLQF